MNDSTTAQLGYKIWDIDCASLSVSDVARLKIALWEHGMICLKKQNLSKENLIKITNIFGEIIVRPSYYAKEYRDPDFPAIIRVGNVGMNNESIPKAADAELWHKDGSFEQPGKNFILTFLHPKIIPGVGGQTGFVDSHQVHQSLSEELKAKLEGATVLESSKTSSFFANVNNEEEHTPDSHHKILQQHPISNKGICFLTHRNYEITLANGEKIDSTPFVDEIEKNYKVYAHKWEEGDLVIWDNLRVIHRGMGGYGDLPRLFFRTQCRIQKNEVL